MASERTTTINIGGEEYELLLSTRATKEIANRYGGLGNLGESLMKSENFEQALGEITWLLALLANQSIQVYNLRNKDNSKPLLTEEEIELLTTPQDLMSYKASITEALQKGTQRNVVSEENTKNTEVE